MEHRDHKDERHQHSGHYKRLLVMAVLSFIAMYILMYAMVDSVQNVYPNINQLYMAALMTMPMVMIEILLMRNMYRNKRWNVMLIVVSAAGLVLLFSLIQRQTAVSDKQFLKGMIPHHAAAILMSEQSGSKDQDIQKLQQAIIKNQQEEIRLMKQKLRELK